ncbi:MAG: hypothetical protein V1816_04775 [Pseudomonadota bacterium]
MNRQEQIIFWREIRERLLKNLGLPPDTPPEKFQAVLEAKAQMDRLRKIMRFGK